ncbi:DNA processing protein [Lishizhenia tianjinensis]|uniref:DNA processing protein n=1 Tax=Lishizhenia tianjinensis TaxID=477690 RepID=A0A1I7BDT4_9FLAO|nr:DNA-processing protein DprA [Lishizhenia tianjinensis]SFT85252.1 DNA processing protein [Lishizhenia tianjinensis]
MTKEELKLFLGFQFMKGIGIKTAKSLIAQSGGIENFYSLSKVQLKNLEGASDKLVQKIKRKEALKEAEEYLDFLTREDLSVFNYLSPLYPRRLKHCADAPLLLFGKGNLDFDYPKTVAIVGTRNATPYGKMLVEELIQKFAEHKLQVVSGLAYGIDIHAHKLCVNYGLSTVGVLGHGLDRIYPAIHKNTAQQMMAKGGLLTEFLPGTKPDRENFPTRNRIVAGMCDATIVVESGEKGGSLITAYLANDYNRDVFAFPGDVNKPYSKGCNKLIRLQRAHLISSSEDLFYLMNWEKSAPEAVQIPLFLELNAEEQNIVDLLRDKNEQSIDELAYHLKQPVSQVSTTLLNLEFQGCVKSLPGKRYLLAV